MASGCIVGVCFLCKMHVFEDEASWYNDKWKHTYCRTKQSLKQENEALKRELEEYKKWFDGKV
jgi:hypothetical protein